MLHSGAWVPAGFELLLKAEHPSFLLAFAEAGAAQQLTGSGFAFPKGVRKHRRDTDFGW